jgi:hypothetical protein
MPANLHKPGFILKLKEHTTAITPECMVYKSHVVRAIDPEVYRRPYIESEAYKIQLKEFKAERSFK